MVGINSYFTGVPIDIYADTVQPQESETTWTSRISGTPELTFGCQ